MDDPRTLFSYRLARDLGRPDVVALLNELTPEEFDGWWAAYLTGRLDDSWAQAAMGCAVLVNVIKEVAAGFAGTTLPESSMVDPANFMPPFKARDEKPDDSVDRFSAALAARFQQVD